MSYFGKISYLLVLGMVFIACNKDSGTPSAAPPIAAPVAPNSLNPNNLPGTLNPNGAFPNSQALNSSSEDIRSNGQIVNRQLKFFEGAVSETTENSCASDLSQTRQSPHWCPITPSQQNIVLSFDANGVLSITMIGPVGLAKSSGPVLYRLHDDTQSLEIAPFTLNGIPTPDFVNRDVTQGENGNMKDCRQPYSDSYVNSQWGPSPQASSFQSGFQTSTPPLFAPQQYGPQTGPQAGAFVSSGYTPQNNFGQNGPDFQLQNALAVNSDSSLFIRLLTTKANNQDPSAQHIFAGEILGDLNLMTYITVMGSKNCFTTADTSIRGKMN